MKYLFRVVSTALLRKKENKIDAILKNIAIIRNSDVSYVSIYSKQHREMEVPMFKGVSLIDASREIQVLVNHIIEGRRYRMPYHTPSKAIAIALFDSDDYDSNPDYEVDKFLAVIERSHVISCEIREIDRDAQVNIRSILLYYSVMVESLLIIEGRLRGIK